MWINFDEKKDFNELKIKCDKKRRKPEIKFSLWGFFFRELDAMFKDRA